VQLTVGRRCEHSAAVSACLPDACISVLPSGDASAHLFLILHLLFITIILFILPGGTAICRCSVMRCYVAVTFVVEYGDVPILTILVFGDDRLVQCISHCCSMDSVAGLITVTGAARIVGVHSTHFWALCSGSDAFLEYT
jgi:hypothetical protein